MSSARATRLALVVAAIAGARWAAAGPLHADGAPCNPDARECDPTVPAILGNPTPGVVSCAPPATCVQPAERHVSAGTRLSAPVAPTSGLAATTPVIAVSPPAVDVGAVEQVGATATATVHITNAGGGSLTLLDVQIVEGGTGGALDWSYVARTPCVPAIPPSCPLAGGATVDLELTFDPTAIGVRDATLLVNYHDTADRSTSIPLRGVGHGATLELVGGATVLDFGALPLGTPAALAIQVVNHGTRALTDATATLLPALAAITVAPGPMFGVTPTAPTTITVTCTPTAAGTLTSNLRLDAPDVETAPIDLAVRCTGDPAIKLTATPPAILLGEVRLATRLVKRIAVASLGGPAMLTGAKLVVDDPRLRVTGAPATTPAAIDLTVAPDLEGSLANQAIITPSAGPPLAVAITGTAVTAKLDVPAAVSLGTFCVDQPTTPRIVALTSTGTATLGVSAPALQRADSPFGLQLIAPLTYPTTIAPGDRVLVAITPERQPAGLASDDLLWKTDLAGATVSHTTLTAMFIDNGPAIAPSSLAFPQTTIHLDNHKAQPVTLQNCSISQLQLDPPQVPSPFSIDSPNFPTVLMPGETTTFSVGFHPTKLGPVSKDLVITSPQLQDTPLVVVLSGEGIAAGDPDGSGSGTTGAGRTSFYACSTCASGDASGTLVFTIAALLTLVPRRRSRTRP